MNIQYFIHKRPFCRKTWFSTRHLPLVVWANCTESNWQHTQKYFFLLLCIFPFLCQWFCSPEEDAQDVGQEQHQADSGGEAITVTAALDLLILWHIRQGSPEHHEAGRQPGHQRQRALHVLLLQNRLCIHHTKSRSGVSSRSRRCSRKAGKWNYFPDKMNSEKLTLVDILMFPVVISRVWSPTFPKSQTAVEMIELIPFNFLW